MNTSVPICVDMPWCDYLRSASADDWSKRQKTGYLYSAFFNNYSEIVLLTIPWPQVRVLAGTASLIKFL